MQEKTSPDPFELFSEWLQAARKVNPELTEIPMTLATADQSGSPSVRVVLLKKYDQRGFVFYTNMESRKATELRANPCTALCFFWPELRRQVCIRGTASPVADAEADEYFATRPRESQIAAWVSKQSRVLASRDLLMAEYNAMMKEFAGKPVPRPPFWSGFRVAPDQFEFWVGHQFRLNERILYTKDGESWRRELLYP